MANPQHIEWLLEGVEAWNRRRLSNHFAPDFEGANLFWEFRKNRKLDHDGRIPLAGVRFGDPFSFRAYGSTPAWYDDENFNLLDYFDTISDLELYPTESRDDDGLPPISSNLAGADLTLADLTGADLSGADISGAKLARSLLANANLTCAKLRDAKLRGSRLIDCILSGADLTNADFREADFTGARLDDAEVSNANFLDADFSGASLAGAKLWKAILFPPLNSHSPKQLLEL